MRKFFSGYYQKLPITGKIMFILLPLSIIPLMVITLSMTGVFQNIVVERTLSGAKDNSYLIINQIEEVMNSAEDCGNAMTININDIYEDYAELTAKSSLAIYNEVTNELSFSLLTYTNIDSLIFYDMKGNVYSSHYSISDEDMTFFKSFMYTELEQTTGPNLWFPLMNRDYAIKKEGIPYLTMGKKIVNINDGSTYGYLLINISSEYLNNLLGIQEYNYWIVNDNNLIISTNTSDIVLSGMDEEIFNRELLLEPEYIGVRSYKNKSYITTMLPFELMNWKLIGQLPYEELTKDISQVSLTLYIMIVVLILLDIIFGWRFTHSLTKPIVSLNNGMHKVSQGNFTERLEAISDDEIGQMADSFNHMSEQVEQLLTTVEEEQQQKREYEMALIQEQIKPHFLYNCLDVIYTLNLMGRQKDAAAATKALADYYRVSLSKGADVITLEDEFKNVKDYLSLQKIRYSDVFDYDIELPAELKHYKIIKLTLQPIVENAIYHGLKPKDAFGHLSISAELADTSHAELIKITVTDNGIGMDESLLAKILEPKEQREHYGIYNVLHRIQLFFGEEYGLHLNSEPGKGTSVTLIIPATTTLGKSTDDLHANNTQREENQS